MKRIVCLNENLATVRSYQEDLAAVAPGWELLIAGSESELAEAEIVLGWNRKAEAACLREGTPLRWVQSWSAGIDYMPLQQLQRLGIMLTTASGVHRYGMSETALGLMLALTRGFAPAAAGQARQKWVEREEVHTHMTQLHGGTVGILGTGEVGRQLGVLCGALGMRVLGCSFSGRPLPGFEKVVPHSRMEEVLAESDVVVNLMPCTQDTQGIISEAALAQMKPTAFYITLGRGPTTDTRALVRALEAGVIAGAGLDVTDPEPLPDGHPLWGMENVIILPHIGGHVSDYDQRVWALFLENIKDYVAGRPPGRNLVDYTKGY